MYKTIFDTNNKKYIFYKNQKICTNYGLIYKDLCGNLFDTRNKMHELCNDPNYIYSDSSNTKYSDSSNSMYIECINLHSTTAYSSIFDDPELGMLGKIQNALNNGNWTEIRNQMKIPSYTRDKSLYNIDIRINNLKRTHKNRQHYAAGGNGSWDNPITGAVWNNNNKPKGLAYFVYWEQLGNIYWIPSLRSYIIIEDENDNSSGKELSHIDIWTGTSIHIDKPCTGVSLNDNITFYPTLYGNSICLAGQTINASTAPNIDDDIWKENTYDTFIDSINFYSNKNKNTIYSYIYNQFSLVNHMTNNKEPLKIYLANNGPLLNTNPFSQPLIQYKFNKWNYPSADNPNYNPEVPEWASDCNNLPKNPNNDDIRKYLIERKSYSKIFNHTNCFNYKSGYFECDNHCQNTRISSYPPPN